MSAPAPPTSLARRLGRSLAGWIGALWLAAALGAAWYARGELNEAFDSALTESAWRLLDLVVHEMAEQGLSADTGTPPAATVSRPPATVVHPHERGGRGGRSARGEGGDPSARNHRRRDRPPAPPAPVVENDYLMYQVVNPRGELLIRSVDAPEQALKVPLANGFAQDGDWRVYTLAHPVSPVFIHVADPLSHRRQAQRDIMLGLLWPLALLLPLLALLIARITRHELASVGALVGQIRERGGHNLQPLAATGLPTELQGLTDSTNHLLQRLSDALDTERALAANAAHELRTPLATTRLRLQAALGHPLTPEARAEVEAALASLTRLSLRAEKLLQLSRAESGAALARERVNLAQVAASVAQEFWADASLLQRLRLQLPEDDDVWVLGDFDALAIALRNLVENAVRYAPAGPITLALELPATLRVSDEGPGIAPERLHTLQQRHQRHAPASGSVPPPGPPGYGLGLAIVHTIVTRQGGTVHLASPPAGQLHGLSVALRLQATPATDD